MLIPMYKLINMLIYIIYEYVDISVEINKYANVYNIWIYIIIIEYYGTRVFANGPGDWGSVPGWVIPRVQEMVLDAA